MTFNFLIVIVTIVSLASSIDSFRVKQHVTLKDGTCPRQSIRQKVCVFACDSDAECPDDFKCCGTDCGGRACVKPNDNSKPKVALEPAPSKNILVETKPMQQQQPKLNSVRNPQCPQEAATVASCSASCQLNNDCAASQVCCEAVGCASKVCMSNPSLAGQSAKAKSFRTATNQPSYDDYYDDTGSNSRSGEDDQNDPSAYENSYDDYGSGHVQRKTFSSAADGFQGPLVNTQNGMVMAYQRNPLYKMEKLKFLNNQLPRYNVQQMPQMQHIPQQMSPLQQHQQLYHLQQQQQHQLPRFNYY